MCGLLAALLFSLYFGIHPGVISEFTRAAIGCVGYVMVFGCIFECTDGTWV